MTKVLIVEDEERAAERLERLILQYDPSFEIVFKTDSVEGTVNYLQKEESIDLIFMDIQLADGISFMIFEQVNISIPVIFVTAYDTFAIRAFEVNSIDYLLKPLETNKLNNALEKFKNLQSYYSKDGWTERLSEFISNYNNPKVEYKSRFLVSKGDSLIPIQTEQVAYFQAEDKAVMLINLQNQRFFISYTLDQLESLLDPVNFFRANRQYLISLKSVTRVHNYFNSKLKLELNPLSGEDVIISREKAQSLKNWMNS